MYPNRQKRNPLSFFFYMYIILDCFSNGCYQRKKIRLLFLLVYRTAPVAEVSTIARS